MNDRELLAAAEDHIAQQLGAHVAHPHPLAQEMTLRDLAVACGRTARPFDRSGDERILAAAGMGTSDFSKALAAGAQALVSAHFGQQSQHRRFCFPLEVRDFRPAIVPAVDAEVQLLPVGEHGEITRGFVRTAAGSTQAQLVRYGRIVEFSRQLIMNDEWDLITVQLATVGPNAARTESALVAAALEGNPVLDDGAPVFHEDYNNAMPEGTTSAPDASALGVAMQALRTQQLAGGGAAGLELTHLAVEPALEMTAIAALHACGLDERISVTVMTALPAGRWFAFSDPSLAPTIAVLSLPGDKQKTPARVEQTKRPPTHDGAAVKVSAELGAAMIGRVGIYRGQAQ